MDGRTISHAVCHRIFIVPKRCHSQCGGANEILDDSGFEYQQEQYTVCLQMNGAVSRVNKKFISHLTRAQPSLTTAATVQVSHALPAVRSLVLTAGLRGQFPRWRRSRKRLSVCSVLRCPNL